MQNQKKNAPKIALITGANKGIGFEIARKLGQKGITVYLGSRNIERGKKAVTELQAYEIDAHFIHLDLDDKRTIHNAAQAIHQEQGVLDILVNNAGLIDPADGVPSKTDIKVVRHTFETNFFCRAGSDPGHAAFIAQVNRGSHCEYFKRTGFTALNQDSSWEFASTKLMGYNASKAALNMLTVQLAWELRETNIKVNSANPGYTNTDLVPGTIGGQPAELGAQAAVTLALLADDGPSGGFFDMHGPVPW